ncbi:MAG: PH domain-containing protein [bacterium]
MNTPETYIRKLHPHPLAFFGFYFGGLFFIVAGLLLQHYLPFMGFIVVVLGVFVPVLGELLRHAETFYILEAGVERTYDFLSSSRAFVDFGKIQDLTVNQGILQRIFSIGNMAFDTAGTGKVELRFYAVSDPYALEKIIRDKMARPTQVEHVAS